MGPLGGRTVRKSQPNGVRHSLTYVAWSQADK